MQVQKELHEFDVGQKTTREKAVSEETTSTHCHSLNLHCHQIKSLELISYQELIQSFC
jgi:hypothetical protein